MSDTEAWAVVLEAGHWDHDGWTVDSRDGQLACSCGAVLAEDAAVAR